MFLHWHSSTTIQLYELVALKKNTCKNHTCLYACVRWGRWTKRTHTYIRHEKCIVILHISGVFKEKQTDN